MTKKRIRAFAAKLKSSNIPDECTLPVFLQIIESLIANIQTSLRDEVLVSWDRDYDDEPEYIEFTLYRDETDEEERVRLQRETEMKQKYERQQEIDERNTLAMLKQKYEQR